MTVFSNEQGSPVAPTPGNVVQSFPALEGTHGRWPVKR